MNLILTRDNYFSQEADMQYMSASQFRSFARCEAAALAGIRREWLFEMTPSMLVGSYVDAHFSNELHLFKAQHPEIFTKAGDLKAEYRKAEAIITRIERDNFFMKYLDGQKQAIMTREIDGILWKCKADFYHPVKAIVDMKIMRDMKPVYVEGEGRLNFALAWGYDDQGAVYQRVEGNGLPFYLAVATKEAEPDISIIRMPQHVIDAAWAVIEHDAPRYAAIKRGEVEPVRCEKCDYCKATKVLDRVIDLDELDEWNEVEQVEQ